MQLVRCEQCGAKALIAASQCPRCAHAFFLRDSRGRTVPMGHCKQCDTYYPRSRGGCRWCGTKVSPLPIGLPALLLGLVVAVCVVGIGVWQYRVRTGQDPQHQGDPLVSKSPVSRDPMVGDRAAAPASAVPSPAMIAPLSDSVVRVDSGPARVGGAPTQPNASPAAAALAPTTPPAPEPASGGAGVAKPTTGPYFGPWTRAVAQSWVNVRGAASLDAAVVGVVTPNTRVELGEVRGGWRRVRSAGFEGWADASFFAVDSSGR